MINGCGQLSKAFKLGFASPAAFRNGKVALLSDVPGRFRKAKIAHSDAHAFYSLEAVCGAGVNSRHLAKPFFKPG